MNAGEGEAADAFTFKSDEALIDWLLTAVTSEDAPRSLGEVVVRLCDERDTARLTLASWQATDTLLAHTRARTEAEQVREIIGQQEQQAAPVRHRHGDARH